MFPRGEKKKIARISIVYHNVLERDNLLIWNRRRTKWTSWTEDRMYNISQLCDFVSNCLSDNDRDQLQTVIKANSSNRAPNTIREFQSILQGTLYFWRNIYFTRK